MRSRCRRPSSSTSTGVLIDSRVAIVRCIEHGLRAVGAPVPPPSELEPLIGPPLIDGFAALAGPDKAAAALAAYRERYVHSSLVETTVVPGAPEALAAVAARVPVALATSKPHAFARAAVRAARPRAASDRDRRPGARRRRRAQGGHRRPARSTALGLSPGADAPLVGDRRHDVEGARANGLACVGVLWGIGDEAELREAGADPIVERPSDLRAAAQALVRRVRPPYLPRCVRGSDPLRRWISVAFRRENSAPPLAQLLAATDPPCCSATCLTIARPSPVPGRPRASAPR